MKKLTLKLLVLTVVVFILFSPVFYFNFHIDPYGIFRKNFSYQRVEPNNHFIKMRYLLNHPGLYDSFICGNSRANNIDNKIIPGGKWYNLYYSLGLPREHLADLKLLEAHDVRIKNVLLCLDQSSYLVDDYKERENDALRRPYPGNLFTRLRYYIYYLFQVPQLKFLEEVMATKPNEIYNEVVQSGKARNRDEENLIEANREWHNADPRFSAGFLMGYNNNYDPLLADVTALLLYCKAHSINVKVLVSPIHKLTLLSNYPDVYFDFLKKLSAITDYYDFTGINKITANNYFYFEPAHYRPVLGNAMIHFIYQNKQIDSVPDFGLLVNQQNINEHLEKLKQQVEQAK